MAKTHVEGWYRDPDGGPDQRWWDGTGWSDSTRATVGLDPRQHAEIVNELRAIRNSVGILAFVTVVAVVIGLVGALLTVAAGS